MVSILSYAKAIFFVSIISTVAAGYFYVKQLQQDLESAKEKAAVLEVSLQTSEDSLALERDTNERISILNIQLSKDLQRAEQYSDELRNTLQKHNLTHLANKKPGLVQKRMQDATNKLWDDLESITDTDRVQSADSGTQSNNSN